MKEYVSENKKGLILVLIAVLITSIVWFINVGNANTNKKTIKFSYIMLNDEPKKLSEQDLVVAYLNTNKETVDFYANAFKIDATTLNNLLKDNYQSLNLLNSENLDTTLLNYLFTLEGSNPELFDNSITPNSKSKEYILGLINYYSKIYGVDFNIAAAIGEVECGYFAKGMLNVNNIYGGMSGHGLLRYKTIEYGVIKYLKTLKEGYIDKGLTTVESIGYIFNPTVNEAGVKIAKPSWVSKVNGALSHYNDYQSIDSITTLKSL